MVDGKVCNAITETSSQVCYICGVSPKNINNIDFIKNRTNNISTYSFGLSTLHARIRFFECLMHISYRLEVKKWQMRSKEEKQSFQARKTYIINLFRKEVGIIISQPKQGSGSSNDGNTARWFFENPMLSAEITGLNIELISRFGVILTTISCGFHTNILAFEKYAMDTAKLYIEHYNWYYMPASVHKILLHGTDVIKHCLLPIEQLSEEASEARNKHYKSFREHFTRKTS
uniref:Uncharacterized protein n=1 Tax=Sipha flava TaxID=143950 RepID=A0A2S2Q9M0_9HEMI